MSKIPDVVVIGAQKSGTSTFYRNLVHVPQLHFTRQKESNILIRCSEPDDLLQAYQQSFDFHEFPKIDVSPKYAQRHIYPGAAEHLYSVNKQARIVYLVRDPIARIQSQLQHNVLRDRIHTSIEKELEVNDDYVLTSSYYYQIEPFLKLFPQSQILVYPFEAMTKDHRAFQQILARFIGLEFEPLEMVPYNVSKDRYVIKYHDVAHRLIQSSTILKLYHLVWRFIHIKPERVMLTEETKSKLFSQLKQDIDRFHQLFSIDTQSWITYNSYTIKFKR